MDIVSLVWSLFILFIEQQILANQLCKLSPAIVCGCFTLTTQTRVQTSKFNGIYEGRREGMTVKLKLSHLMWSATVKIHMKIHMNLWLTLQEGSQTFSLNLISEFNIFETSSLNLII